MAKKIKLNLLTAALIGALTCTGCGGSSDDDDDSDERVETDYTYFNYFNAITDSADIYAYIDDGYLDNADYGEVSYVTTMAEDDDYNLEVVALDSDGAQIELYDQDFETETDTLITYIFTGTIDNPETLVISRQWTDPNDLDDDDQLEGTPAWLQGISLNANVSDLTMTATDMDTGTVYSMSFGHNSVSEMVEIVQGSYDIVISDADSNTLLNLQDLELEDEFPYLIAVMPAYNDADTQNRVVLIKDNDTDSYVDEQADGALAFANLDSQADLSVSISDAEGEVLSFSDVATQGVMSSQTLSAGSFTFTVSSADNDSYYSGSFELQYGQQATLVLHDGEGRDLKHNLIDHDIRAIHDQVEVSVFNSSGKDQLRVYFAAPGDDWQNADDYLVGLDDSGIASELLQPGEYQLVIVSTDEVELYRSPTMSFSDEAPVEVVIDNVNGDYEILSLASAFDVSGG